MLFSSDRIKDVETQRDFAASRLVAAEAEVVRLAQRVASLEAILANNEKVTVLPKRKET